MPLGIPKEELQAALEDMKELQRRTDARNNLLSFTEYTHPNWVTSWYHRLMCEYLEKLARGEIRRLSINAPPRHGKHIADVTPVFTPIGWRTHGDLQPGDFVFAPDGSPTRVIGRSEEKFCNRRILFSDGERVTTHDDHLWRVYDRNKRKYCVYDTATLLSLGLTMGTRKNGRPRARFLLDYPKVLQLPPKDLPFDPYFFGVWLGDGKSGAPTVCGSPSPTKTLPLRDKRIPTEFLCASEEQRRDLLQGLVDSDGHVDTGGRVRVVNTNARLVEDITQLVRSLGYRATITRQPSGACTVQWSPHDGRQQTKLPRQDIRGKSVRRRRSIVEISSCAPEPGHCISVEHPSRTYLVGNTLIPTHNTELASRRFPAWLLGKNPNWQVISTSAGSELAADIGADVRDIVKDPSFGNVFPDVHMRVDAGAAGRWRLNKGGIYIASSVGSQIVGRGANLGIIDDPHKDPSEVASERMRNVVGNWYAGAFSTRLMPPYSQLLIMTRWHQDDLAGRLLGEEKEWDPVAPYVFETKTGWTVLKLPAIEMQPNGEEKALGHVWYPLEYLQEQRAMLHSLGRGREWRAQYQQEPVDDEGTYIRREWFDERYTTKPDMIEGLRVYMAGDFAVSTPKNSKNPDRTEIGVFGLGPNDKLYVLDWWSGRTTPDVWVDVICDLSNKWRPWAFFGEAGMIRRVVEPFLRRRLNERKVRSRRLEWVPSTKDKGARGRAFQEWASSGRVLLPSKSGWYKNSTSVEDLIAELTTFPSGRFDDKFDVLSTMCMALENAHPAIMRPGVKNGHRKRDYDTPYGNVHELNAWAEL